MCFNEPYRIISNFIAAFEDIRGFLEGGYEAFGNKDGPMENFVSYYSLQVHLVVIDMEMLLY